MEDLTRITFLQFLELDEQLAIEYTSVLGYIKPKNETKYFKGRDKFKLQWNEVKRIFDSNGLQSVFDGLSVFFGMTKSNILRLDIVTFYEVWNWVNSEKKQIISILENEHPENEINAKQQIAAKGLFDGFGLFNKEMMLVKYGAGSIAEVNKMRLEEVAAFLLWMDHSNISQQRLQKLNEKK